MKSRSEEELAGLDCQKPQTMRSWERPGNGREGLELILHTNPDLVITDVRMPEMDGLEMLQAMKERNLDVHCVILSGYSEFSYAKKAIGYGWTITF